ncbi:MAG: DNA repair protein RecO [Merismopedia sp. SIO2A8]|nr:DNA repair protein RecO [Merismopedia sp. SIO2A8]
MNQRDRTYAATGITLKSMPMGESDRLLTLLTKEHGLVRAITPGARKPKSSLRAISTAFVVADVLLVKGRNLDRLVQADCRASFPGLSRDLGKLTAAQYLAELVLSQAISQNPQEELFAILIDYLNQLSQRSPEDTLPCLVQGIFQFLELAGIAPQVQTCCVTKATLTPNLTDPTWHVDFDVAAGGVILATQVNAANTAPTLKAAESSGQYVLSTTAPNTASEVPPPILHKKGIRPIPVNAIELTVLQHLPQLNSNSEVRIPLSKIQHPTSKIQTCLTQQLNDHIAAQLFDGPLDDEDLQWVNGNVWRSLERLLRRYAQYHFDQPIRSATLIETCFPETLG